MNTQPPQTDHDAPGLYIGSNDFAAVAIIMAIVVGLVYLVKWAIA